MSKSKLKRLAIQQAPAPARHDHARGAPLTLECDNWCRGEHDRFTRSLEQATAAPAPEKKFEPYPPHCQANTHPLLEPTTCFYCDSPRVESMVQRACMDCGEIVFQSVQDALVAAPAPSATVDEVMALAHRMKDAAIGWGDVYTAMQTLRAAVEQIVRENFTLAAGACIVDGGLVMGEYGHGVCTMMERAEKAEQEAAEATAQLTREKLDICDQRDEARKKAAANKQDAERYRWLRDNGDYGLTQKDGYGGSMLRTGADLDAAIDAALMEGK